MAAMSTGARRRIGAMLDCVAIVALIYGVRLATRSMGITTYSGSIASVLAIALATILLARRAPGLGPRLALPSFRRRAVE